MKIICSNNYSAVIISFEGGETERFPLFELNSVSIICLQDLECKAVSSGLE